MLRSLLQTDDADLLVRVAITPGLPFMFDTLSLCFHDHAVSL